MTSNSKEKVTEVQAARKLLSAIKAKRNGGDGTRLEQVRLNDQLNRAIKLYEKCRGIT